MMAPAEPARLRTRRSVHILMTGLVAGGLLSWVFITVLREGGKNRRPQNKPWEVPLNDPPFFRAFYDFTLRIAPVGDGLGPYYNATSCVECHFHPAAGGMGDLEHMVWVSLDSDPTQGPGGPIVHRHATAGFPPQRLPDPRLRAGRVPPSLYGLGALESIPESSILSRSDPEDRNQDGISGSPGGHGEVLGRFGIKAAEPSLEDFVRRALRTELGILSKPHAPYLSETDSDGDGTGEPEIREESVSSLVFFVRRLPPLNRRVGVGEGWELFADVGCDGCHTPQMDTPRGPIEPYSDLLLHDLGPELADGVGEGRASGSEYRTAPLWGLSYRAVFLHDGRARSIAEAVEHHGGEAGRSRRAFNELPPPDQAALLRFLSGL